MASITLKSISTGHLNRLDAHLCRNLTATLEADYQKWPCDNHLKLTDLEYLSSRPVDIIISGDLYNGIVNKRVIKVSPSSAITQWIIFGTFLNQLAL